tara:strand:- start:181 stop:891 length:711 start_codon:yes stop_codon:yes gene_type:complete
MMKFAKKNVLVTGGSGAIGSEVVRKFASEGATVIIADQSPLPENESEHISKLYSEPIFIQTDLTDENSVKNLVQTITSNHDIHVLAQVAGGFRFGPAIEDMPETDWDDLLDLNLKSVFLMIKHIIPFMKAQNYGRIVSIAARSGLRGDPMVGHYSVSKGGVILLSQTVSEEVKDFDITVNTVLPSIVDTPANRLAMPQSDFSKWVSTTDLANVMLFLASDDARAISGASIPVYYRS